MPAVGATVAYAWEGGRRGRRGQRGMGGGHDGAFPGVFAGPRSELRPGEGGSGAAAAAGDNGARLAGVVAHLYLRTAVVEA